MSAKRASEAQRLFAERRDVHRHLGAGADAAAAEDVWKTLTADFQQRRRRELLAAEKYQHIADQLDSYRDVRGNANPANALRELLEWQQGATFPSVTAVMDSLQARYRRQLRDFLGQHKRNIFGNVRNKALAEDVARALHGDAVGDQNASQLAKAVADTLEQARADFNAAGGHIGKLDDFGLPHRWDRKRVESAGADAWIAEVAPRLDWDRIIDLDTGSSFARGTDARKSEFLREIHSTISTSGWNKRQPSARRMGTSMANQHADTRILHFKTGDDWVAVNRAFGEADPFTTIVTHLDTMARDTAQMRVLGPNPGGGLEFARQHAQKLAAERPWQNSRMFDSPSQEVDAKFASARRMFEIVNGSANMPESTLVAGFFSGLRHFLISSQLGGAMLSAVTDQGFMAMASRHVGMDPGKVIGRHVQMLTSSGSREMAARAGIIADSVANVGVAQARLIGDAYGPEIMERMSEFTMRASGLTHWTDMARGAFRLEFYGLLADNAGTGWDDLPDPLRRLVFEARGITPDDWDVIRATPLFTDDGLGGAHAGVLVPDDIRHRADLDPDQADDLALRLEAAIREQMEFAVPSASLRGRAAMTGGAPGTFTGELTRSGLMYKSFALSMIFNQLGRVAYAELNGSRAANIAMFATVTTLAGAISLQMKDLAKGRDPRPMTDGKFWAAAAIQGGGAGIFGDFLYASQNRFGGGVASTLAGPGVGFANSTAQLGGSLVKALHNQDEKSWDSVSRAAVKYANQYSGPTDLWYGALALDRMVWDNIQKAVDGEAEAAFRRAETRRVKDFANPSWWLQGDPAPHRAPDLSNIGATPQ